MVNSLQIGQRPVDYIPRNDEFVVERNATVATMPYVPSTYWITLPQRVVAQLFKVLKRCQRRYEHDKREHEEVLKEVAKLLEEKAVLQGKLDALDKYLNWMQNRCQKLNEPCERCMARGDIV